MTDVLGELRTLHIHADDLPFVDYMPGLELRYLQARPEENISVVELRAAPGAMTGLHRHAAPVFGITTRGQWGHDTSYEYRPGSYIFETPGVVHRFMNGPEITQAYFISTGAYEPIDAETLEVVGATTMQDGVTAYFEACEAAGHPRPNILR